MAEREMESESENDTKGTGRQKESRSERVDTLRWYFLNTSLSSMWFLVCVEFWELLSIFVSL